MKDSDIELERLMKGNKASDAMAKFMAKRLLAPLVLADTAKNSLLAKDKTTLAEIKKSLAEYPESVFQNAIEGRDVVSSWAPEFSNRNPDTASVLGFGLDILDPISLAAGSMVKTPITLGRATMAAANSMADRNVRKVIQRSIKKGDEGFIKPIEEFVKKNDMRGKLRHPEELMKKIGGETVGRRKISKGTIDEVGQEILESLKRADARGAAPIDRQEIFERLIQKEEAKNLDPNVAGAIDISDYGTKLESEIKPFSGSTPSILGLPPAPNPRISSLEDMWQLKKSISDKLSDSTFSKQYEQIPEKKQMLLDARKEIDNDIIDSLRGVQFREGNAADIYESLNHDYAVQKKFLDVLSPEKRAKWRSKGGRDDIPSIPSGIWNSIKNTLSIRPETQAAIGDTLSKPLPANLAAQSAAEVAELPLDYNRDDEDREFVQVGDIQMTRELKNILDKYPNRMPNPNKGQVREPQSVPQEDTAPIEPTSTPEVSPPIADPMSQKMTETIMPPKPQWDPYINEQVLNTYLPRDTDRLLANPTALMAKMQQVAPNQVPVLQDMLEHDKDGLKEMAPKLAVMFPALFERDKYGMFDGKIVDPQMQQKFLMDLSQDEGLSSIEKATMAMKLRRGENIKG